MTRLEELETKVNELRAEHKELENKIMELGRKLKEIDRNGTGEECMEARRLKSIEVGKIHERQKENFEERKELKRLIKIEKQNINL